MATGVWNIAVTLGWLDMQRSKYKQTPSFLEPFIHSLPHVTVSEASTLLQSSNQSDQAGTDISNMLKRKAHPWSQPAAAFCKKWLLLALFCLLKICRLTRGFPRELRWWPDSELQHELPHSLHRRLVKPRIGALRLCGLLPNASSAALSPAAPAA